MHLELNEGVLSRLWSVRGFGQAWHWLREKRRAESTPLNAFLTYVTLPWSTVLDGMKFYTFVGGIRNGLTVKL